MEILRSKEGLVSNINLGLEPTFFVLSSSKCIRYTTACALGAVSAFAFAPLYWAPLAALSFAGLSTLVGSSAKPRSAFVEGWAFGFAQFVVGLNWITESFRYAGDGLEILAWPAVFGLSSFLALFPGFGAAIARCFGPNPTAIFLALPVSWTLMEWARGTFFTGFPWNLTAYIWGFSDELMQGTSILGSYGLGLLTLLLFTTPLIPLRAFSRWKGAALALLIVAGGVTCLALFGAIRLAGSVSGYSQEIRLRIVQGNVPQDLKWDARTARSILDRYINLSRAPGGVGRVLVVWPETSLPTLFDADPELISVLRDATPEAGALLFGALRQVPNAATGQLSMYNSVIAINKAGATVATYDKRRLVPFGEYTPMRNLLPIADLWAGFGELTPGNGTDILAIPGFPAAQSMICYEAIFPESGNDLQTAWILDATNDAWFGSSSGPYQHYLASRFRAIEQGKPLIRAANTGISAVVDSYGRVLQSLPLGITGTIDSSLPLALPAPPLYQLLGDLPLVALSVVLLAMAMIVRFPRKLSNKCPAYASL